MIQTYENLRSQVNILNNKFEGQVFIQKIYSTAFFICLTMRGMGKSQYLYIGRGAGYEGIWLGEEKPGPFLRKRDTFLEYIRKHLSSTTLEGIEIDNKDRIICIHYFKWGRKNSFRFFYSGRRLYFSNYFYDPDKKQSYMYKSWDKKNYISQENNFECFDEVGRKEIDHNVIGNKIIDVSTLLEQESQLASKNKATAKKEKFFDRKIQNIKRDIEKVLCWEKLFELANTENDFSTYPKKQKIYGVKINFIANDHFKRRDQIYTKVKSFKKACDILMLRLQKTEEEEKKKNNPVEQNILETIKPFWNNLKVIEDKKVNIKNEMGYRVIKSKDFSIAIGLSANGNDEMRKNWAKKEDVWFHMDGDKSAHIILKLGNSILDMKILKLIGSAMLEFSKFDYNEVNLIYTQVKNLKGIPGIAGSVNYKKEKRIRVEKDNNWMDFFNS